MKMREKAKVEKCFEEVRAFSECCKSSSIAMVVKCRVENSTMKACLTRWYQDEEFRKMCEVEYLRERTDYRRTGVKNKPMKKYEGQSYTTAAPQLTPYSNDVGITCYPFLAYKHKYLDLGTL